MGTIFLHLSCLLEWNVPPSVFFCIHYFVYFSQECTYYTENKEKCSDKKEKVCEKFWKEDGYGGKVWTEDPTKCHWLEESECMKVPVPIKDCKQVIKPVCTQVHKNKPQQHECLVCGGVEKSCKIVAEERGQ